MSDVREVLAFYGASLPAPKGDRWLPMRCPFHADSHASAAVNEIAGRFVCHGCMAKSEDAIGLVMWWEECGYRQAAERAASITGGSVSPVRQSSGRPSGLAGLLS